ncbi:MAG: hypothetical protein ACOYBQ_10555 [Fluviibacter sp.]
MTKVQKPTSGGVLSPSEIQAICFYDEMDIRYEIQSDSREWVFIETSKSKTTDEVTQILLDLSNAYKGQAIRAIDMTTGRIVDMT